jgi:hypothetical protein
MHILTSLLMLLRIFGFIFLLAGKVLVAFWPVTGVLAAILMSEWEHRPRKWECRFNSAFLPVLLQVGVVAWAVATFALPFLHFTLLGAQLGNVFFCFEMAAAAYAWHRWEGYRCFALALLLNELWLGFWVCMIAGSIIAFPQIF